MGLTSAIVSAYFCEDFLENRIKNLLDQDKVPDIVATCLYDSPEHKILKRFGQVMTFSSSYIPALYSAWNTMLQVCHSDYVIIANSDDRLAKYAISEMSQVLDDNPDVGLVYANADVVVEEFGDVVKTFEWRDPDADLWEGCYIGNAPMFRRELIEKHGDFDEAYGVAGDWEMWIRLQRAGVKFYHINKVLGTFWDRSDNLEHRRKNRLTWENAKVRRKYGKRQE